MRKTVISSSSAPASRVTRHIFCELSHGSPHSVQHRHAVASRARPRPPDANARVARGRAGARCGRADLRSHRPAPRPGAAPQTRASRGQAAGRRTHSPRTRAPAGRHLRAPHARSTLRAGPSAPQLCVYVCARARVRAFAYACVRAMPAARCCSRAAGTWDRSPRRAMIRNRLSGALVAAALEPARLQLTPTSAATRHARRIPPRTPSRRPQWCPAPAVD